MIKTKIKSLIIFPILLIILTFMRQTLATEVHVQVRQQDYKNVAVVKITSTDIIEKVRFYIKNHEGKYVLFYIATPYSKEVECKITNARLSSTAKTDIKVIIEDDSGISSTVLSIDQIPQAPTPTATQTPMLTPTPTPTPTPISTPTPTPVPTQTSAPTPTNTPIATPTSTVAPQPTITSLPTPSVPTGTGPYNWPQSGSVVKKYSDESIQVSIEKIGDFYVTKIWLREPAKQVKKASASWGKTLVTVPNMLNPISGAIVGSERKWILFIRFMESKRE